MEIVYADPRIVVAVKPAWVLSTTITAMATMVQEQVLPLAK